MVRYMVTVSVDPTRVDDWLRWMRQVHIPDVMATGCWSRSEFYRVLEPPSDWPTFQIHYHCDSPDDYRRYQTHHAASLQREHADRYHGQFRAIRQVIETIPGDD